MLAKIHRLSKTKDVQATLRGQSYFSPRFVIKFRRPRVSSDLNVRGTVIVSTKVAKRANVRNSIKRRFREAFRRHLSQLRPGDYAIIVKPAILSVPLTLIGHELIGFLKKVKLITIF